MKATGIVRRIDDLGRVVIPKEIRRTMRIREGDPLEIYTDREGGVIFRKYSLMGGLGEFAGQICDTMSKTVGTPAVITDRDAVIAAAGIPKRDMLEKRISPELERVMEERQIFQSQPGSRKLPVIAENESFTATIAAPILAGGDVMGCVVFLGTEEAEGSEVEYKLAQTVAGFLGRQLET